MKTSEQVAELERRVATLERELRDERGRAANLASQVHMFEEAWGRCSNPRLPWEGLEEYQREGWRQIGERDAIRRQ